MLSSLLFSAKMKKAREFTLQKQIRHGYFCLFTTLCKQQKTQRVLLSGFLLLEFLELRHFCRLALPLYFAFVCSGSERHSET